MTTVVALVQEPILQFFLNNGDPNVGGSLLTQVGGVDFATYSESTGTIPFPNPIPLNARGEISTQTGNSSPLFVVPNVAYTYTLFDSSGVQIWSAPNIVSPSTVNSVVAGLTQAALAAILGDGPTSAEIAANVQVINLIYPPLCVDRYLTNGNGVDMSAAFNTAFTVAQQQGGIITYGATAPYLLLNPVNFTFTGSANQHGVIIQGPDGGVDSGAYGPAFLPIVAQHTGSAIFDCTGNDSITFRDVSATTDPITYPRTGILTARNSLGGSLFFRANNCKFIGHFSVAPYYNYGSEDDVLTACYWWNFATTPGTSTRVYTANNIANLSSSFTAIGTGTYSCIDHNDFGCLDQNLGSSITTYCIYLEEIDSFKKFGGWAYCPQGVALIYVDLTNGTSNYCVIDGLLAEVGTNKPDFGIAFSNTGGTPCTGWKIDSCRLPNSEQAIFADTLTTLDNFHLKNIITQAGGGVLIRGTLQNSIVECVDLPLTIGVSSRNSLVGDSSEWTITTRSNDVWTDMGTANKNFASGIATATNGWTAVGAITQGAKYLLSGSTASFVINVSGATSIACSAGATIPTLPFASSYAGQAQVFDLVTHTLIGIAGINASTITMPAVTANIDGIFIQGWYFVA
jgi:hypothetical protein